jgi:ADP-ribosyl-[dinitrogen reductase] hydrolase
MSDRYCRSIVGCILGTAVGDALGLPYEGLSRDRIQQFAPLIQGHKFILTKGAISDDTEHTCMVAQSLIVSGGEEGEFIEAFALRLRWWLLGCPAGIGKGTLKAIIRLWQKVPPDRSGVDSAGNGAAMRSAILGVCYGENPDKLLSLVRASTRITHNDPKAEYGAIAVAVAAYLASSKSLVTPEEYYLTLKQYLNSEAAEFLSLIKLACDSVSKKETAVLFAHNSGNKTGISGYVYDTVPTVIQVWLRHQQDYLNGVREIICLGGDTDSTAAILGGIIGASVGKGGIPRRWLKDLADFPRTVNWMERLGERLAQTCTNQIKQPPLPLAIYWIPLRNLLFLAIALFHLARRLLPPY